MAIISVKKDYPELLISVVNNDLRVSSNQPKKLAKFIQAHHNDALKEVPPSFEEVFIGLMK